MIRPTLAPLSVSNVNRRGGGNRGAAVAHHGTLLCDLGICLLAPTRNSVSRVDKSIDASRGGSRVPPRHRSRMPLCCKNIFSSTTRIGLERDSVNTPISQRTRYIDLNALATKFPFEQLRH